MLTLFFPTRHDLSGENDNGFGFFYYGTNLGWGTAPKTRVEIAHYLMTVSAKMQYMVKEVHRIVNKEHSRVLIYSYWPSAVWVVRLVLETLGFRTDRISAGQSAKERADIMARFNDPKGDIDCISASIPSASESYNFQKCCHNIIILDVVNYNIIQQIIGRCYRYGQKCEQFIKIVTANRTIDQSNQSKNASKVIAQLAATSAAWAPSQADIDALLQEEGVLTEMQRRAEQGGVEIDVVATNELTIRHTQHKYRVLFGVRSNRDNALWADAKNPDAKLLSREEAEFFLNHPNQDIRRQTVEFFALQDVAKEAEANGEIPEEAVKRKLAEDRAQHTPQSKGMVMTLRTLEKHKKTAEAELEREAKQQRKMERKQKKRAKQLKTAQKVAKKLGLQIVPKAESEDEFDSGA